MIQTMSTPRRSSEPTRSVVALAGTALLVAISLSGCEIFFEDAPAADVVVGVRDERIVVVNCGDDVPGEWELRLGETAGEYGEFFIASRSEGWRSGDEVSTDPEGWDAVEVPADAVLAPGTLLSVWVASGQRLEVARITIPQRGLPAESWVSASGDLSREPCA